MSGKLVAIATLLTLCAAIAFSDDPNYETVLIPTTFDPVAGAHGALWKSELDLYNGSDSKVKLFYFALGCEVAACVPNAIPPGFDGVIPPGHVPSLIDHPGQLFYVPVANSEDVTFHLLVRDLSRQDETQGTEVPVVREADFLTGTAELLAIPTDSRFRDNLRIYGVDGQQATVHVRYFDADGSMPETVLREDDVILRNFDGNPYTPSYAAIADFQNDPLLATAPLVRIEITPVTTGLRYWAFMSVTNNETQEISLITP